MKRHEEVLVCNRSTFQLQQYLVAFFLGVWIWLGGLTFLQLPIICGCLGDYSVTSGKLKNSAQDT